MPANARRRPMIEKYIQDALILWATIDPIGTLAIFVSQTSHLTAAAGEVS
jgi:multiple antibiotic resistance protein